MEFLINNYWWFILACLIAIAITSRLMSAQQKKFFTMGRIRQSFGILDLQFASTPNELIKLITGIDKLANQEESKRSKRALRNHLYIDFLFMPAIYLFLFLLCYTTALKMDDLGRIFFTILAFTQLLPWLFDIYENIFLLNKLQKPVVYSESSHKIYRYLVLAKWLIASFAGVAAISALSYFWIIGDSDILNAL